MILKFQIDDITDKEADDLVMEVYNYLSNNGFMVTDYWVGDDT